MWTLEGKSWEILGNLFHETDSKEKVIVCGRLDGKWGRVKQETDTFAIIVVINLLVHF